MAQVLAVPGDVRRGFSYIGQFNHDFGRITGKAATIKGNILLCDYGKKNLILVDPLGNYLKKLNVDSEPYDIAITRQNIGYITQPKSISVTQIDPDRMVELFQATCNDLSTTVFYVSAVPSTGRDFSEKVPCFLGVKRQGLSYAFPVNHDQILRVVSQGRGRHIGPCVIKFHAVDEQSFLSCTGGQHYITYNGKYGHNKKIDSIATMDTPADICSDDNGYIYASGQGSDNIHRLEGVLKTSDMSMYEKKLVWKVLKHTIEFTPRNEGTCRIVLQPRLQ
ncbi:unnamed protein product [Mytilus coruscus]|uniref:Uncharacterized protein n=1 Tax=Mytilus coruscus TaxID=42192 RepID=A0A6J8CEF3_MYTCO|nr:unnamed protein product [Mytilus coruscus]